MDNAAAILFVFSDLCPSFRYPLVLAVLDCIVVYGSIPLVYFILCLLLELSQWCCLGHVFCLEFTTVFFVRAPSFIKVNGSCSLVFLAYGFFMTAAMLLWAAFCFLN